MYILFKKFQELTQNLILSLTKINLLLQSMHCQLYFLTDWIIVIEKLRQLGWNDLLHSEHPTSFSCWFNFTSCSLPMQMPHLFKTFKYSKSLNFFLRFKMFITQNTDGFCLKRLAEEKTTNSYRHNLSRTLNLCSHPGL